MSPTASLVFNPHLHPRRLLQFLPMCSNAAARVVETYELAFRIFKHVQDDDGNAALLPITLVNHHVGSIALDILWEEQADLGSLLLVLRDRLQCTPEERFTSVILYEHGIVETDTLKHRVSALSHSVTLAPHNARP